MPLKLFLTSIAAVLFLLCCDENQDNYTLLISFDGFRADYLDWYETPNFDKFSEGGVKAKSMEPVFVSKTFPNHYSIATGMYIENHGLVGNSFYDKNLNETYSLKDRSKVEDERFYGGEPIWVTAEKQNIKTASYYWVGSEAPIKGIHPSIWKKYDHSFPFHSRIDSVLKWFSYPIKSRPKLVMLYFHEPDATGHRYGPNSTQTEKSVMSMDSLFGEFISKLKKIKIYDQLNIIVVSDHGMAETKVEQKINLEKIINLNKVSMEGSGPYAFLYSDDKNELSKTYNLLKKIEHISVYKKNDILDRWHLKNNDRIKDLLVLADEGWTVVGSDDSGPLSYNSRGTHGYDNILKSMQAIFLARGPSFKQNYKIKSIKNIDIYPIIAKTLNIKENTNIDGDIDRVIDIFK